ncbi:hypothetical protein MASR1M101_26490 [Gemmatimonas sp.]
MIGVRRPAARCEAAVRMVNPGLPATSRAAYTCALSVITLDRAIMSPLLIAAIAESTTAMTADCAGVSERAAGRCAGNAEAIAMVMLATTTKSEYPCRMNSPVKRVRTSYP